MLSLSSSSLLVLYPSKFWCSIGVLSRHALPSLHTDCHTCISSDGAVRPKSVGPLSAKRMCPRSSQCGWALLSKSMRPRSTSNHCPCSLDASNHALPIRFVSSELVMCARQGMGRAACSRCWATTLFVLVIQTVLIGIGWAIKTTQSGRHGCNVVKFCRLFVL